jgi:hypothetical protein
LAVFWGIKKASAGSGRGFFYNFASPLGKLKSVAPIGFEPMTGYLEGSCSIQLSYGVKSIKKYVGVAGFEPAASCSQSRRDTGLRYTPKKLSNHSKQLNWLAGKPG